MWCLFLREACIVNDSDACLQASPGWTGYSCNTSTLYCSSWGKDMRRCCPNSCGTGVFTEEDCFLYDGAGECTYPNSAQCHVDGK